MNRIALIIAILFFSAYGCNFDANYQEKMATPVQVSVENKSDRKLIINSIYSKPDASELFAFNRFILPPGKTIILKAPEYAHQVFVNKLFYVDIECQPKNVITIDGKQLVVTKDEYVLELSISIDNPCK